jgi:hypothetical protein
MSYLFEDIMLAEFSATKETDALDIAKLCNMVKQASSFYNESPQVKGLVYTAR